MRATSLTGFVIIILILLAALFAPFLAPQDPNAQNLSDRLTPPLEIMRYPLGSDHLGRDILSRVIFGSRVSLIVSCASVIIAGSLGTTAGILAGYSRGWIDELLGWLNDVQLAIPFILLALAVVAAIGSGLRNLILVFGITGWVQYARVVRAATLVLREQDFIEAAHAIGATHKRIALRHILPNLSASLIVLTTFDMARLIVLEAAMSFLGLGIDPSTPSWGSMLADGRAYLSTAWWVATIPGLAVTISVLGVNLVGDWLRDRLDPTLRI
jgi:peptide/nickel transport system permease protein